jgi:hypothetical protein
MLATEGENEHQNIYPNDYYCYFSALDFFKKIASIVMKNR